MKYRPERYTHLASDINLAPVEQLVSGKYRLSSSARCYTYYARKKQVGYVLKRCGLNTDPSEAEVRRTLELLYEHAQEIALSPVETSGQRLRQNNRMLTLAHDISVIRLISDLEDKLS